MLATCAFYVPQLLTGTVQYDGVDVHYSAQRYLSDELHAGRMPFWTPFIFSGFPFLADLQVGAWYPLNWPFFLFGIGPHSLSGELLLHTAIACVGAYALGVRLLGERIAAMGVALFYGFSGWFAAHSQHVGIFQTAAWLPWLLLALLAIAGRMTPRRVALAGILGAALALPGHFQTALYACCGAAVWAAFELTLDRSWQRARRVAVGLAAVGLWGGLLAAVMILPAAELVSQSVRTQLNARDSDIGFFQLESLLTLVQPDHYGLLSGDYIGPGDVTQHYFYAGIALVPLAMLGARNRRILTTTAFLALPFLWYAAGPDFMLFRLVTRLPGFRSVELPMHGWFLPCLGLALLGGAGLARVPPRWRAPLLAFVFADVLFFNQLQLPLAYARDSFAELYEAPMATFAAQVAAAQPVQRVYGPPPTAFGYRNHALQSRVEVTYGYNPLELASYAAYAAAADESPRLVDALGATHRLDDDATLQPNPTVLPPAYFAAHVTSVTDEDAATALLPSLDPALKTVVVGTVPPVAEPDPRASVVVVERGLDRLVLHYRAATQGLLHVAIPAYPGWHASLRGAELQTLTIDRALLGVVVPSGEGDITMWYAPRLFWIGAAVSLVALLALICVWILGRHSVHGGSRREP